MAMVIVETYVISKSQRHPTAFFLPETNCLEAPRKKVFGRLFPKLPLL